MGSRITQNTFAGGEITPVLIARNDIQKYSSSLKTLRNGFIRQEGCITNRPGLEFVGEVKYSSKKTRLIPFIFNQQQTYVIEFGEYYCRFIQNGGYIIYPDDYEDESLRGEIVEISTPFTEDELDDLYYHQNFDLLNIACHNHPPKQLERHSHYEWVLNNIEFKPSILPPTNVQAVWSGSLEENTRDYIYLVTAVDKNTYEESNRSETVTVTGHYEAFWLNNEKMTISWSPVDNASEYNIYRSVNGIFGYIGTATETEFVDNNIEPDMDSCAPIYQTPFSDNNNPAVMSAYQQRSLFANSQNSPMTMWASQLATNNNFNVSRPLIASNAITMTLYDKTVSEIRHMISVNDLIVLTADAEWKVSGSDGSFDATPPPQAVVQSTYGASKVRPVISGNMILFVQSGGMVIRDLGYTYMSDSYDGNELSIFANHLFLGKQVVYMDYAKEPFRLLWVVFNDGTLAGLTYNKQQEHCGWHRHDSHNGKFECVTVVREGNEDIAYFIINRTVNGKTIRTIERMQSRIINKVSDGFFLDSALKYKGEPVKYFYGLDHLEGETVSVLADGGVIDNLKVVDGAIELPYSASNVVVGLPYTFEMESLNIEGENTHCIKKLVNSIDVKIYQSREDFKCISSDGKEVIARRSIESINNSDLLVDAEISFRPQNNYTSNATIHLKQDKPLPLTIVAISAVVSIGDVA